jgi:hypothetical protein
MKEPDMTQSMPAPPSAASNTGPKPVTMEDIYRLIGALHLEIEVLRRQNAELREQIAASGVTEG